METLHRWNLSDRTTLKGSNVGSTRGLAAYVARTSEGHFVELEECLEGAALAKPPLHRHEDNSSGNLRLLGKGVEVHIPAGGQSESDMPISSTSLHESTLWPCTDPLSLF